MLRRYDHPEDEDIVPEVAKATTSDFAKA